MLALDSRMAMVTKERNVLSSEERLEEVLSNFNDFTDQDFRRKVCELVIGRGGYAKIGRHILENKVWDGELELHFAEPPTAREIANIIKSANHPNDFGMEDDKTLWFWWD